MKSKSIEMIKPAIILPVAVFIFIPGLILYLFRPVHFIFQIGVFQASVFSLIAVFFFFVGMYFLVQTVLLFVTVGNGTPAPWAPPKNFVVNGPYCHVRNPMLLSALLILLAETIVFVSLPLLVLNAAFWLVNTLYFVRVEEPELINRFGESYLNYKKNVRRWLPRVKPWRQS